MKLWGKIVVGTLSTIIGLIFILAIVVFCLWSAEIKALFSIKMLVEADAETSSGPVYRMDISGDYYFDKFLESGGVSNDQELLDFIVKNLTKGIIPVNIKAPTIGCSSFTAQTADGTRLFGRNYDFSQTTSMILRTESSNKEFGEFGKKHATVSSVDLQFLGVESGATLSTLMQKMICLAAPYVPLDGLNDAGVSCGIYMTYQGKSESTGNKVTATDQTTDKPDLTSTTMLRMILDYADDVDEAIKIAQSYDLHDSASTSFHYMVADSTGKSAIFEYVPTQGITNANDTDGTARELKIYVNDADSMLGTNEANDDFQYITNFVLTPNYYEEEDNKTGYDRYNKIQSMINPDGTNTAGIITKEYAEEILQTVGRRAWKENDNSTSLTIWSALYDLTNKTVKWISNERFGEDGAVFELKLVDGYFEYV